MKPLGWKVTAMDKKQELSDVLNAIGALAEMAGLLCRELLKNGFTRNEAVDIVTRYVIDQTHPRPKTKGDDSE